MKNLNLKLFTTAMAAVLPALANTFTAMKRLPAACFLVSLLSLAPLSVAQLAVQVHFDDVADGTLINTHYSAAGVTFDCALGTDPVNNECLNTNSLGFGGNVFARIPPTIPPHTPPNVVAINSSLGGETAFSELNGYIVARFALPATSVTVWANTIFPSIGEPIVIGTTNLPYMNAYDVDGKPLATAHYSNSALTSSPGWVPLTITASMVHDVPIGMVVFSSSVPLGSDYFTLGQFDDLSFTLPTTIVPPVVGMPVASAEAAITNATLTVGPITQQPSASVPQGEIISQTPAGGSVALQRSAVSLLESCGAPVTVPYVIHLPANTAENQIIAAGLKVGSVTYQRSTIPLGDVVSTSPGGFTAVCNNTPVNLVISLGSNPPPPPGIR